MRRRKMKNIGQQNVENIETALMGERVHFFKDRNAEEKKEDEECIPEKRRK